MTNSRAMGAMAMTLLAAAASGASAAPMPFPGGQIDGDRIAEGEIYIGEPKMAVAPKGCEVAAKYTAYLRGGQYDQIVTLFTPDAILFLAGQPVQGEKAITEFYNTQVKTVAPRPIPVAYYPSAGSCVAQIAASRVLPDGKREYFAASFSQFFVAPDGRSTAMFAYGRRSPVVSGTVAGFGPKK